MGEGEEEEMKEGKEKERGGRGDWGRVKRTSYVCSQFNSPLSSLIAGQQLVFPANHCTFMNFTLPQLTKVSQEVPV